MLPTILGGVTSDFVIYNFTRSMAEQGDFSHFLSLYGPSRLPSGNRLRDMMNGMVFGITGYDDDSRELHSIPEVRRFYKGFHAAWPYWLYFCNLETAELKMMVFCCLTSMEALKVDGRPNVAVEYGPVELLRFVGNDFDPMNVMCERAEMSERMIFDRSKAVFEYFDMPFDAESPR
jgi:hypothetical protein